MEYLGDEQLVHMTREETPLQAKLPVEEKVPTGQELTFAVPRTSCCCSNAETEERVAA